MSSPLLVTGLGFDSTLPLLSPKGKVPTRTRYDPRVDHVAGDGLELRDYLRVLRRRRWTVILAMLWLAGSVLTASLLKTPRYRASGELLIAPKASETLFKQVSGPAVYNDPKRAVATEIRVLESLAVEDAVAARLGYRPRLTASSSPDDNVVTVRSISVDPQRAALAVNAYAEEYINYRRESTVEDILGAQSEVQKKIDEKQREIDALDAAVGPVDPVVGTPRAAERISLLNQQNLFRNQLDQLQVEASLNRGGAQLLTPARPPTEPFEPKPLRSVASAVALGLMLGVGLAFLVDYLDDALRTTQDVERATGGLPILGVIPAVRGWRNTKTARTVTRSDPASVVAEAYRGLRTSVQFLGLDSPLRTLQLTSPSTSEGKSTTVANLAVALANAGRRVVVVDCDLRRSRAHDFFDLPNDVGVTSVLLGEVGLGAALQHVEGVDRLRILSAGQRPPNPSELLSGHRMVGLLEELKAEADIVVLDSPPVLPVSDAIGLSAHVDATLLVVRANATNRKSVVRALELLGHIDTPVIGTVLNGAKGEESYADGGYRYGPYYRAEPSSNSVGVHATS